MTTQVLTAQQMRDAEEALFDAGTSVSELMEIAAGGAAEWIRRIAAGRSVTVLCGPGNNGGDGYVIARRLREAGNAVQVIAPMPPKTEAALAARNRWDAKVLTSGDGSDGEVFVDCLFGSGLTRPLSGEHVLLMRDLAARHRITLAVDVPSGIASDTGELLNEKLPVNDVTLALGAWKFAHWMLPGRANMGSLRLVPIGISSVEGAAELASRPKLGAPTINAHKYTRGLCAMVAGEMPGASMLAAQAAMRGGAGYVKLLSDSLHVGVSADLVCDTNPLDDTLQDERINSLLVGPGLGRSDTARARLATSLRKEIPTLLDADALVLLRPEMLQESGAYLATPHDGELEALCRAFSVIAEGRRERATALARTSGMVICAKGPDTVIAAPDGRIALAPPAPSWLSVAGSGDVLAGIASSRLATGCDPYSAAKQAVWLHGEAARRCGPSFTALDLASAVSAAHGACL